MKKFIKKSLKERFTMPFMHSNSDSQQYQPQFVHNANFRDYSCLGFNNMKQQKNEKKAPIFSVEQSRLPFLFPAIVAFKKDDDEDKRLQEAWLAAALAQGGKILDLRAFELTEQDIALIRRYLENNYLILRILVNAPYQNAFDDIIKRNREQYAERPNDYTYIKLSVLTYAGKDKLQLKLSDEEVIKENLAKDPVLSKEWRVLKTCTGQDGYFGAAYINEKTRQIIIANRGTQPDNIAECIKDVITDARGIILGRVDSQQPSALNFAEGIKNVYGKTHKISITGHSLGGWLAQVILYHFEECGYSTHAVTFDSPGARPMLESLRSNSQVKRKVDLDELDIKVYLSAPNAINTCNQHLGVCYRLPTRFDEDGDQFINYIKYTSLAHDKAKILEQFDPKTGVATSCLVVEDWPLFDTGYLGQSNIDFSSILDNIVPNSIKRFLGTLNTKLGLWLSSQFANILVDLHKARQQYNSFHSYADGKNYYEPDLSKLTLHDQYYLNYVAHYKTSPIDEYELPLSCMSKTAQQFLKDYLDSGALVDLKKSLTLNLGESITDLEKLLASNCQIEEKYKSKVLKLPQGGPITARQFYQKLSLYLECYSDLKLIKKLFFDEIRDMQEKIKLIDQDQFQELANQIQQQKEKTYQEIKNLSLQQREARLYLYAEPKSEEVLAQESVQRSLKFQISNYQDLLAKLEVKLSSLRLAQPEGNILKKQILQQLNWLGFAEQYAHAMLCYQTRRYHKTANSLGAEGLLNDLINRLQTEELASENSFLLDKKQLISHAYNLLAKIARSEGKYGLAVEHYQEALKYQPEDVILLSSLGAALNDQGKFEAQQAQSQVTAWKYHKEALNQVAQLTNPQAKSIVYANIGRGLQQLVESKQTSALEKTPLAILEQANYYLDKALELNPQNITARLFRGIVYMDKQAMTGENYQTLAEQDFDKVLNLQSDHPTALRRKALLLEARGDLTGALKCYQDAEWSLAAKPWFPKAEKQFWLNDIQQQFQLLNAKLNTKSPSCKV